LTGDLARRDANGRIYHVDRVPDVVRTAAGPVYSLETEEFLLKSFPKLADCSVVAVPKGDGFEAPLALVRLREHGASEEAPLLAAVNQLLDAKGWGRMAALRVVDADQIPLGTTGKVLKRLLRDRYKGHFAAPASQTKASANELNGRANAGADAE
jgi:acyl-coenzyme A synthetase/AMP-(fatty) acid ligase